MGFFLVTIAVVFKLLVSMPPVSSRFLAVIFIILFMAFTAYNLFKKKYEVMTLILEAYIVSFFLIYQLFKKESTFFYFILSKISGVFSTWIGLLIGKPISMSITYSGIDVAVFFLIAGIVTALIYKRRAPKEYLLYVTVIVSIWGFYIGFWTFLAESSLTLGLNLLEPVTGPLDYRIALFVMLFVFYMYIYKKWAKDNTPVEIGQTTRRSATVLLTVCVAVTAVSGVPSSMPVKYEGKQVVFLDTGIDFSVPEHEKYGLDYVGMFGILPHYLNRQGYHCLTVNAIDEQLLRETDVLVVFNPMYALDNATLSQVWRFVYDGGSLLAVGDHTGDEQVRLPLNAILEPAEISFNFDSAIPFKSLWAEDYQLRRSPIFGGVTGRQAQIVVGASLDTGYKAKPLVIGKEGFSDLGDIENTADGYLGDMHFSRGERIGDLALVAEASYGAGKFMAFGDTTSFQNTVIPYSYPMIDNIFAYLSDNGRLQNTPWEDDGFFKASCIIDASHLEVFARDKSANAADGLIAGLMRAGIMPFLNQNQPLAEMLEKQSGVQLVILLEPATTFTETELNTMKRYMETGGTIILCAGYGSPAASKEFAEHFGFSFDPMPLGRVAPDKNPDMAFWNACPIMLSQGVPLYSTQDGNDDAKSLMEVWGYSTMVYKPFGHGGLYVFADPDFLKNKNLESVDTYREGNVLFLDEILKTILI